MAFLYIIIGIVILFVLMNLNVVLRAKFKKGKSAPELGGRIGEAIRRRERVMLYFYSPTCSACKVQTPIIDKFLKEPDLKAKIFKINVSQDINIALKLGVMGTPSTVLIEDGKIKEFFVGVKSEKILRKYLQ